MLEVSEEHPDVRQDQKNLFVPTPSCGFPQKNACLSVEGPREMLLEKKCCSNRGDSCLMPAAKQRERLLWFPHQCKVSWLWAEGEGEQEQ